MSRAFVCAVLALFVLAGCQSADDGAEGLTGAAAFYHGKNIRWIVPYSPGGGYDEYARLVSPYLQKHTGARIDIFNLPGAGGMRGVNDLFNAPQNGLTIGLMNGSALIMNELAGMRGADYRIAEFAYLGRLVADRRVFVVSLDSGVDSFEELLNSEDRFKMGATGLGGSTYVDAVIMNEAFDLPLDIIHGFDSSSVVRQAMLRGNVIGTWGSWGSATDGIDTGRHKVILQSGRQRHPDLPDTPTAFEVASLTQNPERTLAILNAWESLHAVGRPVAAPAGTRPDRLVFLEEAFRKTMQDPELLEEAANSARPVDYISADEMRQVVEEATHLPPDIQKLFISAVKGEL
ncbi:MAG: tripartite tricarboxylate transporter substrate-binding protein [Woeseia sp.]